MSLKVDTEISLGDHVKDGVTGYEGYVTAIAYHLTGCIRFGVRAEGNESSHRPEEEWFSQGQIEKTDEAPIQADTVTTSEVELGDRAIDDVTNTEGFATTITFNLYNCPRAALTVTQNLKGKGDDKVKREWFDIPRLYFSGGGISDDYGPPTENESEGETGAVGEDISRTPDRG